MNQIILFALFSLLGISVFGYTLSILQERQNLIKRKIEIKSNTVTQALLDGLDMKIFKIGKLSMNIGDEVKIVTLDKQKIKGTLLGAKKQSNRIFLLTKDDEVVDLAIKHIDHLVITSKYGRLF